MSERAVRRNSEVLTQYLSVEGRRVLDVGCGEGALLGWLTRRGAEAWGLDLQPEVCRRARQRVPDAPLVAGRGETLPFAPASFDFVVYFNSLHHLPVLAMDHALAEVFRVLRPTGRLAVFEPLAEGPWFEVMRPLEDETELRAAAYGAILRATEGRFALLAEKLYTTLQPVGSADELVASMIRVDPAREHRAASALHQIAELLERHATTDERGRRALAQPMRFDLLAPRAY